MSEETKAIIEKLGQTMNERFTRQDEMMQQLIRLVAKNTEQISDVDERLNGMNQEMDERFNSVDERFNSVDERFNSVDERFNSVDERFNSVDERLDRIEVAVNRIEESEPANIMSILKQINTKLDIQALNK